MTHDTPTILARAETGLGTVALRRRGRHLELVVGGAFAMDTVDTTTEVELARQALRAAADPRRVLVGGLGLGFTARAVLADERVERLDVVEICQPLLDWARGGLDPALVPELAGLEDDPRCRLWAGDMVEVLTGPRTAGEPAGPWDLVLLDVDNGPGFLIREANASLYAAAGLRHAAYRLTPGGTLAIWSSHRAPALLGTLRQVAAQCGGTAGETVIRVHRDARDLDYALYSLRR